MKVFSFASVLALASTAVLGQFDQQSKPFKLVAVAKGSKYNGQSFFSCHEGAGIEGLCISNKVSPSHYTFNTSKNAFNGQGWLTWELNGDNFKVNQVMSLGYNLASNVAIPLFGLDDNTIGIFDNQNLFKLQSYIDDTKIPINASSVQNLDRWYICDTYFGYAYTTLAWQLGKDKPQNPSCVKASVKRVFV